MFFNANGLLGKADEISRFVKENDVDFCFIVETWLSPNSSTIIKNPFINIINYRENYIEGGRRAQGGILGFCEFTLQQHVRVIEQTTNYCFIKIGEIIFGVGYFSPTLDYLVLEEFMDKAEEYSTNNNQQCVLLGDFNARMRHRTGDSKTNARGIQFSSLLDDSPFNIILPSEGKYTSVTKEGRGITDLVLTSDTEISNLIIHETESLGGSDHRPLTFSIITSNLEKREFQRWNIRKFATDKVKEKYMETILGSHIGIINRLNETNNVEDAWYIFKQWIEAAADKTCGRFKYSSEANKRFWTKKLNKERAKIQAEMLKLQGIVNTQAVPVRNHVRQEVRRLTNEIANLNKKYRSNLIARRSEVFEEIVNNIGNSQNSAAFARMVKTVRNRNNRVHCGLSVDQMQEHERYFQNSFNGQPNGRETIQAIQTEGELPTLPWEDIASILLQLPLGKAAGIDGIMPELLAFGKFPMAKVLAKLFEIISIANKIPEDWCTALIVPVFKKKGSDQDIKNYRPIALTCLARRVYEKAIAMHISKFQEKLHNNQGGFRRRRSTLDQVFCLQELINNNQPMCHVLLDLQTAYDIVDRNVLWHRLAHHFGIPGPLIKLLQMLFDHNHSHLIIQGKKSRPIKNTRGLLQGSSLSPMLFNFFINDLIEELENTNIRKPKTGGVSSVSLFFADDGKLHTYKPEDMQLLLNICGAWSTRVGMKFSPTKCYVVSDNDDTILTLYNVQLPTKNEEAYLGIPITNQGINWDAMVNQRTSNCRNAIATLSRFGFNANGWPMEACIRVYKTFLRPTMEYGIALKLLDHKLVSKLQKTQNLALRTMFSVPKTTSANAMMKLAMITPMKTRNYLLNIGFACRLHNSNDAKRPAVKIWWNNIQDRNRKNSLTKAAIKNPLWGGAIKANHLTTRLTTEPSQRIYPKRPYSDERKKAISDSYIQELDRGKQNIAGTIVVEPEEGIRELLKTGRCTKKERNTIIRWILGTITRHEQCKKCHGELNRNHALRCSEADTFLQELFPEVETPPDGSRHTILDNILNRYRQGKKNDSFYNDIYLAISKVYVECHELVQAANGFWIREDAGIG